MTKDELKEVVKVSEYINQRAKMILEMSDEAKVPVNIERYIEEGLVDATRRLANLVKLRI